MLTINTNVASIDNIDPENIPDDILCSQQPLILKGLVKHWPLVKAATSPSAVANYLRRFAPPLPVQAYFAGAEQQHRFFYNDDFSATNFEQRETTLAAILDNILHSIDEASAPAFYMGSTTVDYCLPALRSDNDLNLARLEPLVSIWLGNETRVAAHYDVPDNIACVAAGRRRFILFPPDQVANLYVGPLDFTPAGQPISLVDFHQVDFKQYPRFASALEHAQLAELAPGDAIFIPSMWWHHVEGLDKLNVLINYWWRSTPSYLGMPKDALQHALLALRELPAAQRQAWKALFDYYVFDADEHTSAHIPAPARGSLAPLDDNMARRIRRALLNQLNR